MRLLSEINGNKLILEVSHSGRTEMEKNIQENNQGKQGPEVFNLEEMVGYQEGSVVSREIIRKPTGTVTLFAFDEGQGLSEHIAPFDALVCILDGEAEILISGVSYRLKRGEMVIMPANQTHALKAPTRFKMMLVMIRSPSSK
jgi:quercetin dioxygenase-like cupin family protein